MCTFSRFFLQRLFVPHDYKDAPISELPKLGEKRIVKQLELTVSASKGADISLLFRDGKVRNVRAHHLLAHCDYIYDDVFLLYSSEYIKITAYCWSRLPHFCQPAVDNSRRGLHYPNLWTGMVPTIYYWPALSTSC